ncbi:S-layer homology domain-containing protein [Oscillibacter sp. MSJ-31]|uniref:S-layer homology domain-containing protein n=1 Tax=Oscillibacter sp. MSJ-31 TaxID=2841526 RepID=UPI001C1177CC|nr:S-layer homology domain-containing protein [Oscillibacter sp. MSJ-31]MBU5457982.1 S-layer homology domain-containing protein [Oscillibacter sp. MSJ-31]
MANEISKNSSPGNASPAPQQIPLAEISDLPGSTSTRVYTPKELGGLVSSIQSIGVREPIIVRRTEDGRYQLLAGQRRRKASELAKKATIPALVYEMTLQEALDYHKAQAINPMAAIPGKAAALSKPEGKQDTPAAHTAPDKGKDAEKPTPAASAKSEPAKTEDKQSAPAAATAPNKGKDAEKPTPATPAKAEPVKPESKQAAPTAHAAPNKDKDAEKPTPAASAKAEPAKTEDKQTVPAAPTAPDKGKDAEKPTPAVPAKSEPAKTEDTQTVPAAPTAPDKGKGAEKPTPATPAKVEPAKTEDKQTVPAAPTAPDKGKGAEKPTPAIPAKAEPVKTDDKQTAPAVHAAPNKDKDAEKPTPATPTKAEPVKAEDKQAVPAAPTAPDKGKETEKPAPATPAKSEPAKTEDKQATPAKAAAKAPSGPAAIGPTGTAITQVFEARLTPPSEKDLKELPVPKEGESYFITLHPAYLERSKFNNFSVDKNSENFKELRKAVEQAGIKDPVLARPREGGGLEILSGQRRHLIGTELNYPIPTIIQRIDDADAKILVADSNLHRDKISTYDLSRALKMKMEGMKQKAGRKKKGEVGERLNTDEALAREMGITVSKFNRMQRTKSKILSILLSLVMLLSLLPTTALATESHPAAEAVLVDGGKYFGKPGKLYYKNGDSDASFSGTSTDFNAAYDPDTGILTLQNYNGGSIVAGGATTANITIKLLGNNTVTGSVSSDMGGNITITSDSSGELSITNTLSGNNKRAIGIEAGLAGSYQTGNVTIMGDAKVIISATNNNNVINYAEAYGIFAKENITISGDASVDITCATPDNTTGGDNCNGLRADKDVTIDTNGTIKIDVTNAGKDENSGYSFGVYPMGTATLTKVGNMEVKWKKEASNSVNSGGAVYKKGTSLSGTDYAINEDETNCYASYRFGTPYTVTVENGTLTGPGVPNASGSGMFLKNDTVNITPSEMKGKSGEKIPFQKWTSEQVTFTDPTAENNSFNVPANAVTVTAKHNPFVGAPTFTPTGTTGTDGTLTFKTKVKTSGDEYFNLVKAEDDSYHSFNPGTSSTSPPYEYRSAATSGHSSSQVEPGDYYVAEKLNGAWYLSEKFTVSYTAAPTPTTNISLDTTGTVDFGSLEASYTTAPTAQTVTITNNGTVGTGALTIALEGTNAGSFTVSPSSITDIAASGTDTFTVQPNTGLSAGIYTATVKVSGTGVTEQSFDVKFTVTAPATPITDTLVPVTDLTGKKYNESAQEPAFGGGLTRDTDYTVSYEVKSGFNGTLNSDGKPVGAGTYVVTVAGKGSYTGSFTEDFKIDKADPVYTEPTAKTGLAYTGSPLKLITKGSVSKGGEMQYNLDSGAYSTTIPTATDAGNYTVHFKIVENNNYNAVAEARVGTGAINIAQVEWGTPTETLTPVNPTTPGGNDGQITGTTNVMQYKKPTDSTWTDCTGNATSLTAGTYYVRYKADSNHTASDTKYKTVTLTDPGTTLYGVTVTGGTAAPTGDQAAGAEVTITANAKTGFNFKEWTGLDAGVYKTGSSKTSNPATFTMPASTVNVTATYEAAALIGTVNITGTLKYGQELTATLTGDNNTGNLDYKWYQNGTTQVAANNTGKYTLRADDIGKTITVKVSSTVQTGEITSAATAAVVKADGPAAPSAFTLTFTLNSDGTTFTATIPTVAGGEYSFDGTNYSATNTKADCTANTSYTGHVRIAETPTQKASAATSDTQTSPKLTVATPTFTPNGASGFTGTQSVNIYCTTAGAKIYYTTDGTTPTTTSTEYTTALSLTSTTTVKAIAVNAGMNDSAIATATFTKYSGGGGGGGGSSSGGSAATPSVSDKAAKELKNAKEGSTVTIDMKGETKLPASVTKEIAGKDVTVELDMGGGMVWSFNGLDVPKGGVRLDLGVKTGTKAIPAKVINALTGETTTIQLQLNHNGPFGMSLNLSVDLGKKHNGLYANLYFYNSKSGELEFQSAGMISGGKASWAFDHASDYAIVIDKESHEPMTFIDVPASAYYAEAVNWAVAKKITGGIGNDLFAPNDPCTRAQIVTFLWRAAGSPAPKNTGTAFGDVKPGSFYEQAVAWAVENGITGGTGDGKFSPDATCTRAQSVTFLYRAAGSPAVSGSAEFGDVATNAYYADAVAWAAKNGVTDGIGGGQFGSGSDCTRSQIVTFMYRAYNK